MAAIVSREDELTTLVKRVSVRHRFPTYKNGAHNHSPHLDVAVPDVMSPC